MAQLDGCRREGSVESSGERTYRQQRNPPVTLAQTVSVVTQLNKLRKQLHKLRLNCVM